MVLSKRFVKFFVAVGDKLKNVRRAASTHFRKGIRNFRELQL